MKTLDDFLDEINKFHCICNPRLKQSAKIIIEMKNVIDQIGLPMSMRLGDDANKYFMETAINKILNGDYHENS